MTFLLFWCGCTQQKEAFPFVVGSIAYVFKKARGENKVKMRPLKNKKIELFSKQKTTGFVFMFLQELRTGI